MRCADLRARPLPVLRGERVERQRLARRARALRGRRAGPRRRRAGALRCAASRARLAQRPLPSMIDRDVTRERGHRAPSRRAPEQPRGHLRAHGIRAPAACGGGPSRTTNGRPRAERGPRPPGTARAASRAAPGSRRTGGGTPGGRARRPRSAPARPASRPAAGALAETAVEADAHHLGGEHRQQLEADADQAPARGRRAARVQVACAGARRPSARTRPARMRACRPSSAMKRASARR